MPEGPFGRGPLVFAPPGTPGRGGRKERRISFPQALPSRAPGLIPDPDEWARAFDPAAGAFPPADRVGGADIFIGGAADNHRKLGLGVMRDYAERYRAETGRPTAYFASGKTREVLQAVRKANRSGGPVNIVGHSLGATDAYNVAAAARREGLRVDNLVTLDPVGGRLWPYRRDPGSVAPQEWTNVAAEAARPDRSDRIARLGGKPSQLPVEHADKRRRVDANHADVGRMMREGGARAVLDRSRNSSAAIHDELTPDEWMKRRNAAAIPKPGGASVDG